MHDAFSQIGDAAASTVQAGSPHPLMHRTESVDYGVVIEGELTLVLDTGEVQLRPGSVVVQRGTNHAWANRSGAPCRMLFVLVDGRFDASLAAPAAMHSPDFPEGIDDAIRKLERRQPGRPPGAGFLQRPAGRRCRTDSRQPAGALQDWEAVEPRLRERAAALEAGTAAGIFAFDPAACSARCRAARSGSMPPPSSTMAA